MTLVTVPCSIRVYVDRRDITPWVGSVEIDQAAQLYRVIRVHLLAWHLMPTGGAWDIVRTYDDSKVRADWVMTNGRIPPEEQEGLIALGRGKVPSHTVSVFDYVYRVTKKRPDSTIVLIPGLAGYNQGWVDKALENCPVEVGARIEVWQRVDTVKRAVERLAQKAGISVRYALPSYPMQPYAIDPRKSFWTAIKDLVKMFAPKVVFNRHGNTVIIGDEASHAMGGGNTMTIPKSLISDLSVKPYSPRPGWGRPGRLRPNRIILTIPPCAEG